MSTTPITIDHTDLGIIDRLLAVHLEVNIWSARKKLTAEDLGEIDLPPDELVSLGSKKICNPETLRVFGTLKNRAVSVLKRYGVRFLGGYAIPQNLANDVSDQLEEIEEEFNTAKAAFLNNYDRNVQSWVSRHKEQASIIQNSLEPVDRVRGKIAFASRFYGVTLPQLGNGEDASLNEGILDEVAGFGRALFDDIAQAASEAWEQSFKGKDKVSHKALSPIKNVRDKLTSFTFVDPLVAPVAEIIDAAIKAMPKRGYIEGTPLIQIQSLVSLLRDTEALADLAERRLKGQATDDIISGLIPDEMFPEGDLQGGQEEALADSANDLPIAADSTELATLETEGAVLAASVPMGPVPQALPLMAFAQTESTAPAASPEPCIAVTSAEVEQEMAPRSEAVFTAESQAYDGAHALEQTWPAEQGGALLHVPAVPDPVETEPEYVPISHDSGMSGLSDDFFI